MSDKPTGMMNTQSDDAAVLDRAGLRTLAHRIGGHMAPGIADNLVRDPRDDGYELVLVRTKEIADLIRARTEDTALLDALEAEALVRCVGVHSQIVDPSSILATRDGYKVTWSPTTQGLPINMLYRRTLREAIGVIRGAAVGRASDSRREPK